MIRVAGVDLGFRVTGVALADITPQGALVAAGAYCVKTAQDPGKKSMFVSHQDADCAEHLAKHLVELLNQPAIQLVCVELPHGGAKGARANRCMGIATGVMASVRMVLKRSMEYYTPRDTRIAATGTDEATKQQVIDAMHGLYEWQEQRPRELEEAVADAFATIEAARRGGMLPFLMREAVKQGAASDSKVRSAFPSPSAPTK